MAKIKIRVSCEFSAQEAPKFLREIVVETESTKTLTASRVARILARTIPGFRRRKGRFARFSGSEVLPVLEVTSSGWCAWRLHTEDDSPSGFEPPLPGRAGKANSDNNPYADRSKGIWERADIFKEQ